MPIVKEFYPTSNSVIAIWQQQESLNLLEKIKLTEADKKKYAQFKIEKRKKEWLCVRHILKHILATENFEIEYDENRKPNLKNSKFKISISHCSNFVAVFLNAENEVGIDIEQPRNNILEICSKFLSADELGFIEKPNAIEKATILWSAKESLYKFYAKRKVDFKKHLLIKNFDFKETGKIKTEINLPDFKIDINVNYLNTGNYFLTWVS